LNRILYGRHQVGWISDERHERLKLGKECRHPFEPGPIDEPRDMRSLRLDDFEQGSFVESARFKRNVERFLGDRNRIEIAKSVNRDYGLVRSAGGGGKRASGMRDDKNRRTGLTPRVRARPGTHPDSQGIGP